MKTPEEWAVQIREVWNEGKAPFVDVAAEVLRAYGDERAAAEQRRCLAEVEAFGRDHAHYRLVVQQIIGRLCARSG